MSYATIATSVNDPELQHRTQAAVAQEAWSGAASSTAFGAAARADSGGAMLQLIWPVATDNAAAYESAVIAGNPNPGGDPSVITDAAILSAVQAHWPDDAGPA